MFTSNSHPPNLLGNTFLLVGGAICLADSDYKLFYDSMSSLSQYHKNDLGLYFPNVAESYPGLDLHQAEGYSADSV